MANILFIDNFDSFTYNLVDQFRELGHQVTIFRNDYPLEDFLAKAETTENCLVALSPARVIRLRQAIYWKLFAV